MAKSGSVIKPIVISLAAGALITGLLYAIENVNLTGRKPLSVDVAALSPTDTRKELLAKFADNEFACGEEKSDLGKTICWTEIESFNGIKARYFAFFFGEDERLTAFKLAAYAKQYQALIAHFDERHGQARRLPDAPVLSWPTGAGVLTMAAQAPSGQEATVLWVDDPELVRSLTDAAPAPQQ